MKRALAVFSREVAAAFHSPVACVVLTVFLAVSGHLFYSVVGYYSLASARSFEKAVPDPDVNVVQGIVRPYFTNLAVILLFFLPMLSMRLFSEERKAGTLELLLSYPVRDGEVVLGKFGAALLLLVLLLSGSLAGAALLSAVAPLDPAPFATSFLGLLLMGGAFLSWGLFASTLTSNQIVAAVLTFGGLVLVLFLEWAARLAGPGAGPLIERLSILEHFGDFAKGVIDLEDVAYYAAFTVFFLYAAVCSVELRRTQGL